MHRLLVHSSLAMAIALASSVAISASAQDSASSQTQTLKARCNQLISYYDRYGAGRSENSDGVRNHTRLAAELDCKNGHVAEGVAEIEDLLKRKKFDVPPPPTGIAQAPAPLRPHGEARHGTAQ